MHKGKNNNNSNLHSTLLFSRGLHLRSKLLNLTGFFSILFWPEADILDTEMLKGALTKGRKIDVYRGGGRLI